MAAHPDGGASFSGDLHVLGDISAQSFTGETLTGAVAAASFSLTAGVTPGTPAEGMIFANAANHHLYFYNGSAWVQCDN